MPRPIPFLIFRLKINSLQFIYTHNIGYCIPFKILTNVYSKQNVFVKIIQMKYILKITTTHTNEFFHYRLHGV